MCLGCQSTGSGSASANSLLSTFEPLRDDRHGIQSPQSSFPSCSAAPILNRPSTNVTLEISPCGRPCPRRTHTTTHAHHARGTACSHTQYTMSAQEIPSLPARHTKPEPDRGSYWCQETTRDRDEHSMIRLSVSHSVSLPPLRCEAGWDLKYSCQSFARGVSPPQPLT